MKNNYLTHRPPWKCHKQCYKHTHRWTFQPTRALTGDLSTPGIKQRARKKTEHRKERESYRVREGCKKIKIKNVNFFQIGVDSPKLLLMLSELNKTHSCVKEIQFKASFHCLHTLKKLKFWVDPSPFWKTSFYLDFLHSFLRYICDTITTWLI